MKRLQERTEKSFQLSGMYIAEVVDDMDPKLRDRVRVKVHGLIDEATETSSCPWAEQCGALLSGSTEQVGISTAPHVGTFVYVSFLHGDPSFPIYYGYVRGKDDASEYHDMVDTPVRELLGPEPESLHANAAYPRNNVIHTTAGIMYFDETPENERIGFQHKTGSYVEIRPDGTIVVKSFKDEFDVVVGDHTTHIDGNEIVHVVKDSTTNIDGTLTDHVIGAVSTTYDSTLTENVAGAVSTTIGATDTISVSGAYTLTASKISLN